MRASIFIVCGMILLMIQVFIGGKAFFPEAFEEKDTSLEEILSDSASILDIASSDDISFLASDPEIIVGVDPNFYPLEMFDERGRYTGLGGDYLKILSQITGLRFKPVAAENWAETEKGAREGKIDLFMAAAKTGRRGEFLLFTPPYVNLPGIVMTRRDSGLEKLDINSLKGKKVAVVDGYSWHDFLREHHPEIEIVPAANTLDAIDKVVNEEADAVLDYEFNLLEKIRTSGIMQMQKAGEINSKYGHAMAVRKDNPELFNIISLAMKQITPQMQARLAEKWLKAEKPADSQKRFQWLFFFLVESLLVSIGVWQFVKWQGRAMAMACLKNYKLSEN